MGITSSSLRFVRAKLSFTFEGQDYDAGERLINTDGAAAFPWSRFEPIDAVGKLVKIHAEVLSKTPFKFNCNGYLTCEQTDMSVAMGMVFILGQAEVAALESTLSREGMLPDFIRKFPRIAYEPRLQTMPSRVILGFFSAHEDLSAVCDVDNLSPTGLQVASEDQRIMTIAPGDTARLQLQPRGRFYQSIRFNAAVRRIIHSMSVTSGNKRWHLGLGITAMEREQKELFTEMLRLVVSQL